MSSIDINKTYRTRNGLQVVLYAIYPGQNYPVHGAVFEQGAWYLRGWKIDGSHNACSEHPLDLIEVKPRHKGEFWANIYATHVAGHVHRCKEDADLVGGPHRAACIKIEYDVEEGEGLD